MTRQITAVELAETFSKGLKLARPPSAISPETPSESATPQASIAIPTEASQANSLRQSVRAPLKCKWEMLSVIAQELLPVINKHYSTVRLNGDPLDPNWDYLFSRERVGDLAVWTARTESGTIVGYAICMGSRGMFSHSVPMCCVEAIWLDPLWRGGMRGVRFIKSMVNAIRELGVAKKIRIFSNDEYDVGEDGRSRVVKAFRAAGFRQTGTIMELDF